MQKIQIGGKLSKQLTCRSRFCRRVFCPWRSRSVWEDHYRYCTEGSARATSYPSLAARNGPRWSSGILCRPPSACHLQTGTQHYNLERGGPKWSSDSLYGRPPDGPKWSSGILQVCIDHLKMGHSALPSLTQMMILNGPPSCIDHLKMGTEHYSQTRNGPKWCSGSL